MKVENARAIKKLLHPLNTPPFRSVEKAFCPRSFLRHQRREVMSWTFQVVHLDLTLGLPAQALAEVLLLSRRKQLCRANDSQFDIIFV